MPKIDFIMKRFVHNIALPEEVKQLSNSQKQTLSNDSRILNSPSLLLPRLSNSGSYLRSRATHLFRSSSNLKRVWFPSVVSQTRTH